MRDFVLNALRRASLRWPARTAVKKAARVGRNKYSCAQCLQIVPHKAISIDHVAPCVDPETGFTTWDSFISRLFVPETGLQALCKACHDSKSKAENARRKEVAKPPKEEAKRKKARRPRKGSEERCSGVQGVLESVPNAEEQPRETKRKARPRKTRKGNG